MVRPLMAADAVLKAVIPLEKPWGFYGEEGRLRGMAVSYFMALSKELGEPISIQAVPENRLVRGMVKGTYDLSVMFLEDSPEKYTTSLEPTIRLDKMIVGLKGLKIEKRRDIEGLRLAQVRGSTTGTWIDNSRKVHKVETANYSEALWLLKKGRVDAVAATRQVLDATMKKHGMSWQELDRPFFLSCRQVWLKFSKLSPRFDKVDRVSQAAGRLRKGRNWQRLLDEMILVSPDFPLGNNHLQHFTQDE